MTAELFGQPFSRNPTWSPPPFPGARSHAPMVLAQQDLALRYTWIDPPFPGFAAAAIVGRTDADLFGSDLGATLMALKRRALETRQRWRHELAFVDAGHTYRYDLTLAPLIAAPARVIGIISTAVDSESWRIGNAAAQLIGQELHDGVGQEVTGLSLMAAALAERAQLGAEEKPLLAQIRQGLDRIGAQVQNMARGLLAVPDDRNLCATLAELAARTNHCGRAHCTFRCTDAPVVVPGTMATQLLRVAQEAIHNCLRHARAEYIELGLRQDNDSLILTVTDDGVGLNGEPSGLGTASMRQRALALGGALHIGPASGGGTSVTCVVPRS